MAIFELDMFELAHVPRIINGIAAVLEISYANSCSFTIDKILKQMFPTRFYSNQHA